MRIRRAVKWPSRCLPLEGPTVAGALPIKKMTALGRVGVSRSSRCNRKRNKRKKRIGLRHTRTRVVNVWRRDSKRSSLRIREKHASQTSREGQTTAHQKRNPKTNKMGGLNQLAVMRKKKKEHLYETTVHGKTYKLLVNIDRVHLPETSRAVAGQQPRKKHLVESFHSSKYSAPKARETGSGRHGKGQ